MTVNPDKTVNAPPQGSDLHESEKPVVLALWASAKMVDEVSEFCSSGFETVKRFDFEVMPASDIGRLTGKGEDPRRYSAILLAYAEDDQPVAGVEEFVREWARYKAGTGEKPMIICREGLLPSATMSPHGKCWHSFIESLCEEFSADIIRDSRLLFSALQSGNTERCN